MTHSYEGMQQSTDECHGGFPISYPLFYSMSDHFGNVKSGQGLTPSTACLVHIALHCVPTVQY